MNVRRTATSHRRGTAALTLASMLVLGVSSCGSDDSEDAYCDAWKATADAYAELRAVDVTALGIDGLRTAVEDLDSSLEELAAATENQAGDDVQRFRESAQQLIDTVLSPDLPVDRRDEVAVAVDDLRSAWDDVAAAVQVECPDVNVTTG